MPASHILSACRLWPAADACVMHSPCTGQSVPVCSVGCSQPDSAQKMTHVCVNLLCAAVPLTSWELRFQSKLPTAVSKRPTACGMPPACWKGPDAVCQCQLALRSPPQASLWHSC